MIKFSIGGRDADPQNLEDALMAAALESVRDQITERIGTIRDPKTGEFPTVVVSGDSLDHLTLHVEGSDQLVALVKEHLGIEETEESVSESSQGTPPRVFLSYTSADNELAKKTAEALQASLIPPVLRAVPGVEIASAHMAPTRGRAVGGDFYDVHPTPAGWGVAIGDVCGKGEDAASVTAVISPVSWIGRNPLRMIT